MSSQVAPLTPTALAVLNYVHATRCVQVASMTLMFYDHVLTLREEVDFVWRGAQTRSWPRVLFLAARYLPFMALLANTSALFTPHSITYCRNWLFFHGWSGYFFFAAVQVISMLRLWAVYRSRRLLLVMGVVILIGLAGMATVEALAYTKVEILTTAVHGIAKICGPKNIQRFAYAFWIPPIVIETLSVTLVLYKSIRHFQEKTPKEWGGSRFMQSIAKYSVAYFIVALFVYVANFYIWLKLPIPTFELFIPLTFTLPAIAGNRMLLSLREIFYTDHLLVPGQEHIGMKIVSEHGDGITVETQYNPYREFESFFGDERSKGDVVSGLSIRENKQGINHPLSL